MQKQLRISVTDLDAHDYLFRSEPSRQAWLDMFLHTRPRTEAMQRGINFEEWLMNGIEDTPDVDHEKQFVWGIEPKVLPEVVSDQIPVVKWLSDLYGYKVNLSGRIDALGGNGALIDWKTTGSPIEFERYHDSWQWRCYLWMTGYKNFEYHVFRVKGDKYDPGVIQEYQVIKLNDYDDMEKDIISKTSNYVYNLLKFVDRGELKIREDGVVDEGGWL